MGGNARLPSVGGVSRPPGYPPDAATEQSPEPSGWQPSTCSVGGVGRCLPVLGPVVAGEPAEVRDPTRRCCRSDRLVGVREDHRSCPVQPQQPDHGRWRYAQVPLERFLQATLAVPARRRDLRLRQPAPIPRFDTDQRSSHRGFLRANINPHRCELARRRRHGLTVDPTSEPRSRIEEATPEDGCRRRHGLLETVERADLGGTVDVGEKKRSALEHHPANEPVRLTLDDVPLGLRPTP